MSKQRETDVAFLRELAGKQPKTWAAAISHAADELEKAPTSWKPTPTANEEAQMDLEAPKGDS